MENGDLPAFCADAIPALAGLSWSTTKTVDQMCQDHWSLISTTSSTQRPNLHRL